MLNKEIDIQCAFMDVAIMRQLYYCKNKKDYCAVIFMAEKCDLLYDRLDNLIADCDIENEIDRRLKGKFKYEIIFKNGSSMTLRNAGDPIRSYKFHDMIIDTDIKSKIRDSYYYAQALYFTDAGKIIDSKCVELKIPKDTPLSCFRYDMWK